jgi:hypothetical protein
MAPQAGDLISGKYRIVRLIGDGGMGSVYEARHQGLGTAVALKFLHGDLAERPGLTDRFLREARVAATIQSPHVAHVTDVDVGPDGLPYLVMELLGGESLQHFMDREHKVAPAQAVDFALQIAAGLEAAHAVGVVHRDLKPDNVFVTPSAGGPLLKLIDFGIAKAAAGQEQRGLTRAGVVMGTAEYMPPEQLYSAHDVDGRADVYALGVILFEMLSGRRPADGDDAQVIVGKVMAGDVLSLAALEPSLPTALVELVRRATAADPNARFASAHELRLALSGFATQPSTAGALAARPAAIEPPPQPTARTLAPEARDSFAKGSTEQAPPLGPGYAAIPALTPHGLPAPPPGAHRARKSRGGWLAVVAVLVLAGASLGGYALWASQDGGALPPPPPEQAAPPPTEAFTAEGQATVFTPTPTAPTPTNNPAGPRDGRGSNPTPEPTATTTADAGFFPVPLKIPSTFPPLPIPSSFPTALPSNFPNVLPLPSVLPTTFPTTFPGFPGVAPSPAPATNDAGKKGK